MSTLQKVQERLEALRGFVEDLRKAPWVNPDYATMPQKGPVTSHAGLGQHVKTIKSREGHEVHVYRHPPDLGWHTTYAITHDNHPDSRPIASIEVSHDQYDDGTHGPNYVSYSHVDQEHRNKGLATALYRVAIKRHKVLHSDDRMTPGSQAVWEGIARDEPKIKVKFAPEGKFQGHKATWMGKTEDAQDPEMITPPEPEGQESEPEDPAVKQSIQILRDLLERVEYRREEEAAKQAEIDTAKLAVEDARVLDQKPESFYICYDADNAGNLVARAEEQDDEKALSEVSNRINAGQDAFRAWATKMGGQVIEAGGDEGLAKMPGQAIEKVQEFKAHYEGLVGATVTIGIGQKISQATKARMLGKLRGKNTTVVYDESVPKELEARLQDEASNDPEKRKMFQAMRMTQPSQPEMGTPEQQMPRVPKWGS